MNCPQRNPQHRALIQRPATERLLPERRLVSESTHSRIIDSCHPQTIKETV
ncbi:MAG: hypothetical protein ACJAQ3_001946 [Planctomycetota bacterium]|jgi:hypothetical protein